MIQWSPGGNIALYEQLLYAVDREETTPDGREMIHMTIAISD